MPTARPQTTTEVWEIGGKDGKFLPVITMNTAFEVLKKDQRRNLFPANDDEFTTWVDRNPRKVEVQVKFGGSIWYIRKQQLNQVYQWIWNRIIQLSPEQRNRRVTGRAAFRRRKYRQSTVVMVDRRTWINVGQGAAGMDLRRGRKFIKPNSEVRFVNIQPYSRRIEHGSAYQPKYLRTRKNKTTGDYRPRPVRAGPDKGKTRQYIKLYWSPQAKRGVFQVVAKEANRRFRGVAQVDYRRMSISQTGYTFRHQGGAVNQLYPTIRVRPDRGASSRVK